MIEFLAGALAALFAVAAVRYLDYLLVKKMHEKLREMPDDYIPPNKSGLD